MQLMKNITLTLIFTLLLAACSSGTTVSDLPQNVTSRFQGTFQTTVAGESGSVTIDLIEDAGGGITGNIIFTPNGSSCLRTSTVAGSSTGFNIVLGADQAYELFTITTTVTSSGGSVDTTVTTSLSGTLGTVTSTDSNGAVTTVVTTSEELAGILNMQFVIGNNGTNINGTYTVSGNTCTNSTNSGTMNLNG